MSHVCSTYVLCPGVLFEVFFEKLRVNLTIYVLHRFDDENKVISLL